ncbi:MAG: hydrogenase maturation nickel metallochaperone HypA [Anaerolineaceae bacterium]|nr:hydrogenase maturation nickel metallochaperone HypA [Anaerolineaceae bacterium]
MHELAVTESILSIAEKHALQADASRVTDIHIVIGKLASIVDDSVQFYWDMIAQDTICAGATLHFTRKEARLVCLDCNQEYILEDELSACPHCGSIHVKVISGDEFWLESIEIEK